MPTESGHTFINFKDAGEPTEKRKQIFKESMRTKQSQEHTNFNFGHGHPKQFASIQGLQGSLSPPRLSSEH